ncbi:alpha/beta hydrolase [Rhodobacteraceae bacterium DSL-40]|uniref:alpha/beta hydrolase n=1 Tax=Amaricoccus sp. B4 TaxID=3368557 RepID=UPI000DAD5A4D
MAYLGLAASPGGLRAIRSGGDLATRIARHHARLPAGAPIVILIHGYRFDPHDRAADPHRHIFAFREAAQARRARSWPRGLGFTRHADAAGLCIGFGWPAQIPHLGSLMARGRTGFAQVYSDARGYGAQLAHLMRLLARHAPGRRVDIVAHSLGARVALAALPALEHAPGRMILLGAAEFDGAALAFLSALRTEARPEIYNVTARSNDAYDALFETFAPRRGPHDRALGLGLGRRVPDWLDIQLDRADVTAWVNDRGIPLTPAQTRLCHWSFYTRSGAFGVYRAILGRKPGWDINTLRNVPGFGAQEPRWSRMRPGLGLPGGGAAETGALPAGLKSA